MSFSAVEFARRHDLGPELDDDPPHRVNCLFELLDSFEDEVCELLMSEPYLSPKAALRQVAADYLLRTR